MDIDSALIDDQGSRFVRPCLGYLMLLILGALSRPRWHVDIICKLGSVADFPYYFEDKTASHCTRRYCTTLAITFLSLWSVDTGFPCPHGIPFHLLQLTWAYVRFPRLPDVWPGLNSFSLSTHTHTFYIPPLLVLSPCSVPPSHSFLTPPLPPPPYLSSTHPSFNKANSSNSRYQ